MDYFNNIYQSMPIFHDDFRFMQDFLIEGIQAIFRGLSLNSDENFIVYGCEVTDNGDGTLTIADGFIWLNGELLKVDQHSVTIQNTGLFVFQKQTSTKAGGERDASGVVVNPWQLNRAVAVEVQSILPNDLSIYGRRLNEQLNRFLKSYNPKNEWKIVGNDGGLTALDSNFAQTDLPLSWRITPGYSLQITGRVQIVNNLVAGERYTITDFKNIGRYPIDWGNYEGYYIKVGENEYGEFGWQIIKGSGADYWRHRLFFKPFADISAGVILIDSQTSIIPLN